MDNLSDPRDWRHGKLIRWLWRFRFVGGALLSAVLCRLSTSPFDWRVAVLICWAPLIVAASQVTWRKAVVLGLIQGAVLNTLVFSWLWATFHNVAHLSILTSGLLLLLFVILQGLRSAFAMLLFSLGLRKPSSMVWIFPLALVAAELLFPCPVPWYTSIMTRSVPEWMQLAEVGGPFILTGWVALVNAAFAFSWLLVRHNRRNALWALAAAVTVTAGITLDGERRMLNVERQAATAESALVGVVQGNLAPAHLEKRDSVRIYRDASLELLRREPQVDILVWPEAAISYPVDASRLHSFFRDYVLRSSENRKERINVPLLSGVVLRHSNPGTEHTAARGKQEEQFTNSVLLVNPSGTVQAEYDKNVLIPLSERPLLPHWLKQALGQPEGAELSSGAAFEAGSGGSTIEFGAHRINLSICFEELLHRRLWQSINEGSPDLLVNVSSDSWFGDSPAADLHLALATLRAVEHRRYYLRAATTGDTVLISPTGVIEWSLPKRRAASGAVRTRWLRAHTMYEIFGDAPWYIASFALFVLIGLPLRKTLKRPASALEFLRARKNSEGV